MLTENTVVSTTLTLQVTYMSTATALVSGRGWRLVTPWLQGMEAHVSNALLPAPPHAQVLAQHLNV